MLQTLFNTLYTFSYVSVIAVGFSLIYRASSFLHFTHALSIVVGPYTFYTIGATLEWTFYSLLASSMVVGGIFGVTLERAIYYRLRKAGASSLSLLLVSLGTYIAVVNFISIIFGRDLISIRAADSYVEIVGYVNVSFTQIIVAIYAFSVLVSLYLFLYYTNLGVKIRAVCSNSHLASIAGIKTDKIIALCFFMGSALASGIGVLVAVDTGLYPNMGLHILFLGVVASIIGGADRIFGAVKGACIVSILSSGATWALGARWEEVVVFSLLIVYLLSSRKLVAEVR